MITWKYGEADEVREELFDSLKNWYQWKLVILSSIMFIYALFFIYAGLEYVREKINGYKSNPEI